MATRKGAALHTHPPLPASPATRARRTGRHAGRKPHALWLWVALAVLALVGGVLALILSSAGRPSGRLSAEHQVHDFGQVPILGGLVVASFPLTAAGETLVTDLTTS